MSSREERERGWHANPEAATASGGHLTPETVPSDPWADPLAAPLPSEIDRMGAGPAGARTEMFPPSEQTRRDKRDAQPPPRTRRRRVPVRRVKRTLKHIDPLTVLKLSGFYWAVFLVVWLIIVAILYSIIEAAGFFDTLEDVNNGFALGWGKLDITLGLVEKWAFLIGITFALITTLVNVFLAFLYNVAADLIGGLELTFVERDT